MLPTETCAPQRPALACCAEGGGARSGGQSHACQRKGEARPGEGGEAAHVSAQEERPTEGTPRARHAATPRWRAHRVEEVQRSELAERRGQRAGERVGPESQVVQLQ